MLATFAAPAVHLVAAFATESAAVLQAALAATSAAKSQARGTPAHRIGVSVPLNKLQEALAVGGRRRKAAQSGGIFRANPDAPLAAPRLAELHKPTQGLICVAYGGCVSSRARELVPTGSI